MSETIADIATPQAIATLSSEAGAVSTSEQPGVSPSGPVTPSASHESATPASLTAAPAVPALSTDAPTAGVSPSAVTPSQACGCARKTAPPLIYAIGQLNYDFGTEARRDSFKQQMPYVKLGNQEYPPNPYDQKQMVDYLKDEEHRNESTALIWVLNLELTPIYALDPVYPYAPKVYEFFRQALEGQIAAKDSDNHVSRVSIPGTLTGRTIRLFSGQVVPVVEPQYRGMYAWNVNRLIDQAIKDANLTQENSNSVRAILKEFLNRIYYDLRNLGSAPQDRALNYTATNAFQVVEVWNSVSTENRQLADMQVVKSPYCRMDSDCWDIKLIFFDPENDQRARKVYRFTIDVSDMLPVTVGEIRSWTEPAA